MENRNDSKINISKNSNCNKNKSNDSLISIQMRNIMNIEIEDIIEDIDIKMEAQIKEVKNSFEEEIFEMEGKKN